MSANISIPAARLSVAADEDVRESGDYVLYWMVAARRPTYNFSLEHAVAWAKKLHKPLLVFEALRSGYAWASDRMHRFVMQGMRDNAAFFKDAGVRYYPYLEPARDAGKGLLKALAMRACVVVSDDWPCFFVPNMLAAAKRAMPCRFELCDTNGLLPMRLPDKAFPTAYAFRRYLQKELPNHLTHLPKKNALAAKGELSGASVPAEITKRWPMASSKTLQAEPETLAQFPIDHDVGPASFDGGFAAAANKAKHFVAEKLGHYADGRNHPDLDASSGFSPFLHWGHLSVHEVFAEIVRREGWELGHLARTASGSREGWWGMSKDAEAFLDEIITWREIGFNMCVQRPDDYDKYRSLPDWAQTTLAEHAGDARPHTYSAKQLEAAQTHDSVWNAAQNQLVRQGTLHNYMRMLWGKKILHWSKTPQQALATLIHLNNKYGVDGRDPNSYSGIFWTLGRFDRPWPERDVFGKVRTMTSESTQKKLRLKTYLEKFSDTSA